MMNIQFQSVAPLHFGSQQKNPKILHEHAGNTTDSDTGRLLGSLLPEKTNPHNPESNYHLAVLDASHEQAFNQLLSSIPFTMEKLAINVDFSKQRVILVAGGNSTGGDPVLYRKKGTTGFNQSGMELELILKPGGHTTQMGRPFYFAVVNKEDVGDYPSFSITNEVQTPASDHRKSHLITIKGNNTKEVATTLQRWVRENELNVEITQVLTDLDIIAVKASTEDIEKIQKQFGKDIEDIHDSMM